MDLEIHKAGHNSWFRKSRHERYRVPSDAGSTILGVMSLNSWYSFNHLILDMSCHWMRWLQRRYPDWRFADSDL